MDYISVLGHFQLTESPLNGWQ